MSERETLMATFFDPPYTRAAAEAARDDCGWRDAGEYSIPDHTHDGRSLCELLVISPAARRVFRLTIGRGVGRLVRRDV